MKKIIFSLTLGMILMNPACKNSETRKAEQEIRDFISHHEETLVPLSIASNKANYKASVSGKKEDYNKAAELQIKVTNIYTNKAEFSKLKQLKESGFVKDALLARQLDKLYLAYLQNQANPSKLEELIRMQSEVENKFAAFRSVVGSQRLSDNQVDSILHNSGNSVELREVWESSKQIGLLVAPDVLELVKKRNELAKSLGFKNYHQMSLMVNEEDPKEVLELFNDLDKLTRKSYAEVKNDIDTYLAKKYGISKNDLMPWHYQNRFFQEAPDMYNLNLDKYYEKADVVTVVNGYYRGIGLPIDDIIARSDLYEKEGKNQHAFCTDIDRNGDVRILVNVRNNDYWMNTLLHELGHGAYSKYFDPDLPFLLRDAAHMFTTEAIANMFGRFEGNSSWIHDNLDLSDSEQKEISANCRNAQRVKLLVFSRWAQVMFRFEKSMYENPDQDLNKLWWGLVERYQLLKRPKGRNEPDWASKIHIATYPCYYHNYLMGDMLASQLYYHIAENILHSKNPETESFTNKPEVGKYLIEKVFKPGARYPWNDMIEQATGEKLNAKSYARALAQ